MYRVCNHLGKTSQSSDDCDILELSFITTHVLAYELLVIITEGMVVLDLTLQVKKVTSPEDLAISMTGVNLLT